MVQQPSCDWHKIVALGDYMNQCPIPHMCDVCGESLLSIHRDPSQLLSIVEPRQASYRSLSTSLRILEHNSINLFDQARSRVSKSSICDTKQKEGTGGSRSRT